jgi:hypothetical protein
MIFLLRGSAKNSPAETFAQKIFDQVLLCAYTPPNIVLMLKLMNTNIGPLNITTQMTKEKTDIWQG